MDRAEVAIEGTLGHPAIMKRMAGYGYDKKRIMEGKTLLNEAKMLQSAKNEKKGDQREASVSLKRDHQLAWKTYVQHVKLARMGVEEGSGTWKKLQLSGARKRSFAGWLEQARSFYHELSQYEDTLEKIKISQEEIAQAQAMVEAVKAARQQHKFCKSEAEQYTQTSRQALQALHVWMKRFLKIAAVALEEEEQMLEALGIVVKA